MKKQIWIICILLLSGCGKKDVIKEGKNTLNSGDKETVTTIVKLKNDRLTDISIDETYKDTTKGKLKYDYGMKKASTIGKEWFEQISFLETYIKDNGTDSITIDEQGKAKNQDVLSGCTMSIDRYLQSVKEAMQNASINHHS